MMNESSIGIRALKGIPLALIILASLVINGVLIRVVYNDIRMQTATNMFLLSQSIADVAATILVMLPSFAAVLGDGWLLGDKMCIAHGFFNMYFTIITLSNLAMISLERYFAITRISYQSHTAKQKVSYTARTIWVVAFFGAFPWAACFSSSADARIDFFRGFYVCGTTYKHPLSTFTLIVLILCVTIFAFAPFAVISFSFYRIMKVIRGGHQRVCPLTMTNHLRLAIDVYSNSAYTSLYVITTSLLFVFPACFIMTIDGLQILQINRHFETLLKWLMWFHCVIKPLIYARKSPLLLRKFRRFFAFCTSWTLAFHDSLLKRPPSSHTATQRKAKSLTAEIKCVAGNFNKAHPLSKTSSAPEQSVSTNPTPKSLTKPRNTRKIEPKTKAALNRAWSLEADVGFCDIKLHMDVL